MPIKEKIAKAIKITPMNSLVLCPNRLVDNGKDSIFFFDVFVAMILTIYEIIEKARIFTCQSKVEMSYWVDIEAFLKGCL
jgi:hypothetical protein